MNDLSMYDHYTPKEMPELKLFYQTLPGEVDVCEAKINGGEISEGLYDIVVDSRRAYWESRIEDYERQKAQYQREDCMIESFLASRSDAFDCLCVGRVS